jgi:hypothetical protein
MAKDCLTKQEEQVTSRQEDKTVAFAILKLRKDS